MLKTTLWIHGHNFRPQRPADGYLYPAGGPYTDVIGYDLGWGTAFGMKPLPVPSGTTGEDPTDTWFHVAIPTPSVVDGQPMFLDRFYLLFLLEKSYGTFGINAVNAWDANQRIYAVQAPRSYVAYGSGDWSVVHDNPSNWQLSNVYYPRHADGTRHPMKSALGISVLVRAYGSTQNAVVTFIAAGADFHDVAR